MGCRKCHEIYRLISTVSNGFCFPAARPANQRKITFAEMEELAERDDFGGILTAAGIPDTPIPEARVELWGDLVAAGRYPTLREYALEQRQFRDGRDALA